jgi:hypothetical protein
MAATKVSAKTEDTSPALTDLAYSVKNPGTTPVSRKVLWSNIFGMNKASSAEVLAGTDDAKFLTPLAAQYWLDTSNRFVDIRERDNNNRS